MSIRSYSFEPRNELVKKKQSMLYIAASFMLKTTLKSDSVKKKVKKKLIKARPKVNTIENNYTFDIHIKLFLI